MNRTAVFTALAMAIALASPASAQTKLRVPHVAASDSVSMVIAKEQGFFKKRGLDVEIIPGPNGSNFPAALVSGTAEIAAVTTPVLLQANAGGIDLVIVAAGSASTKDSRTLAALVRPGSGIASVKDFTGHKVGVGSVGGFLAILFQDWLQRNGVDPARVPLLEAPFPQMGNLLGNATFDAAVVPEPMISRIGEQTGAKPIYFAAEFPELPVIIYIATREWAESHKPTVEAFAAALREGMAFAQAHPDEMRAAIGRSTGLPAELIKKIALPTLRATIQPHDLQAFAAILQAHGQLPGKIDAAKLVMPTAMHE
jgi:NitT/TauT family transport system substrate-binding protein